MEVAITRQAGLVIVTASGRLSSAAAGEFQSQLLAALEPRPSALLVDFTGLKFISSSGLRALILAAKHVRGDDYRVHLCGMIAAIHEIFEVSGLLRIFVAHPSREAGMAAAAEATH